jgi:hypothetical protein
MDVFIGVINQLAIKHGWPWQISSAGAMEVSRLENHGFSLMTPESTERLTSH